MALSDRLARQLAALPARPGVYLWKDAAGEILYVGKAANLRTRVPNYFADEQGSAEREVLQGQIADLETIIVPSEAQALLLENNLIKEHQPRFNIRLRDDKSYPQVAVTLGEPFPRVLVVRRVSIPGARYFGPYTDVATLRRTLKIIRRLFTVRSCHCDLPLEQRVPRVLLPLPPDDLEWLQQLAPEVDWHVPQRGTYAKLAELAD